MVTVLSSVRKLQETLFAIVRNIPIRSFPLFFSADTHYNTPTRMPITLRRGRENNWYATLFIILEIKGFFAKCLFEQHYMNFYEFNQQNIT